MNKKIFNQNRIGEIRPNQLITTFGPGAIHDAVKDSVTILDINYWGDEGKRINDGRLASYFGVNHFRSPKTSDGNDLPVVSFPYYHVCSNVKCNNLFDIRKKIDIPTYNKQGPTCPICGYQAYPSRFVVACNEGHLDDFPWNWWVHRGKNNCNGDLTLYSTGWTSTLGEIMVKCSCGAKRSMAGSTDKDEFGNNGYKCTGHHPHRPKARNETCNSSEIYPSQRGASNIYFPVIRSAISIPPWTNPLHTLLDDHYVRIIDYRRDFGEDGVSKVFNNYFSEKYTRAEFDRALKVREEKIKEFIEIKEMEYKAFVNHNELEYKKDYKFFKAFEDEIPSYLKKFFSRVIRIERLREVMVLQGFMRIDPPEPEVDTLNKMVKLQKTRDNWLPGVEVNGEGIFIEFNKKSIDEWMELSNIEKLSNNFKTLFRTYCNNRGWENAKDRDAQYVLLHTFSHMLIKEMSLLSGYSSTAIKERIYSSDTMNGILLYTGSSDKDGSLGGLVELGSEENFRKLLKAVLENSLLCTTDPQCTNHDLDVDTLNGSACHSCSMVSETACENGNRLLDRSLIVPLDGKEENSFFKELVEDLCEIKV
ncbi:DUF1998 domain-containing protein [Acholeplasma laidlawii]|uniref:DUF1998 domain-containing protein n=1 Tax=Acholeplasma laidlawii TaxID=2148 RepID=UPI0021F794DF|nr:DUF1998 domain-containing protein [Acholeplasma laidlawii]